MNDSYNDNETDTWEMRNISDLIAYLTDLVNTEGDLPINANRKLGFYVDTFVDEEGVSNVFTIEVE